MGILNVTPDSFFEKSRFSTTEKAIEGGLALCKQGADIIDIGGESSRPGAAPVSEQEELARVIPVIEALRSVSAIPLSIDTTKAAVAAAAIKAGATFINDISGFRDPAMQDIAAQGDADICIMHMQGTPRTMQINPSYPEGVVKEIINWFECQIELLVKRGVPEGRIVLDPGVGFGKSVHDNLAIVRNIAAFRKLGFPLLVGISRKSFMSKILGKTPDQLLAATLGLNALLIQQGVNMIRVHDVQEHRDMISVNLWQNF